MFALGDAANRNPPLLKLFDRFGHRRDEVEFHPAWHELMRVLVAEGLHTSPWARPEPGAHVERAAAYLLWAEIENGTQCPATMTYGAVPALAKQSRDFAEWMPRLLSRGLRRSLAAHRAEAQHVVGMGMTEKQGGSDVRSNTTRAVAVGTPGPGREYRLTGHKWFSLRAHVRRLPGAGAGAGRPFLFLRSTHPSGWHAQLTSYPAVEGQGRQPIQRFERSRIRRHPCPPGGGRGPGIPAILEMGVYTRLDCALGTTGIMHQCVAQAIHTRGIALPSASCSSTSRS